MWDISCIKYGTGAEQFVFLISSVTHPPPFLRVGISALWIPQRRLEDGCACLDCL